MHVHRSDDEAWHVLQGALRFRFPEREVDAPAGTTVLVPAGSPHTYRVAAPGSRYLIFLTPRLDRLIAKLRSLPEGSDVRATLAEFDTETVGRDLIRVPHAVEVYTASFPSVHATLPAVTYLSLGALLIRVQPRWRVEVYILGCPDAVSASMKAGPGPTARVAPVSAVRC